MMEKKSYRKALLMPRPRRLVPPRWMITILFCIIFPVFFGVFFSAIEHGERSCCTSPNSKNDALSCLAEPKNAVFYDSAVGPVLVLLYHCAADAQAIVFFFLLKVFPSRDAIGPHEESSRPYLAWMRRCRLRGYSIHTKYSDNLYRLSVDLRRHVLYRLLYSR